MILHWEKTGSSWRTFWVFCLFENECTFNSQIDLFLTHFESIWLLKVASQRPERWVNMTLVYLSVWVMPMSIVAEDGINSLQFGGWVICLKDACYFLILFAAENCFHLHSENSQKSEVNWNSKPLLFAPIQVIAKNKWFIHIHRKTEDKASS